MCVLPMYEELEDRTPKRFRLAITVSFSFLFVIFVGFASLGYLIYGEHVAGNILDDLPHSFAGNAARAGMLIVVMGVYPIIIQSMLAPIREIMAAKCGWCGKTGMQVVTAAVVIAAMCITYYVTNLGVMNTLNGAFQVAGFIGVAPGLVGYFLMPGANNTWRCMMVVLIFFSFVMSLLGFFYLDNDFAGLIESCILWAGTGFK